MDKLQNNSLEMKTVVETFVIEETAELIYDNEKLDKWNGLVDELGLKGQSEIVKPEKSPIPFMHLKNSLVSVFDTLCPRKVEVEEYNITPIPVEILDLIALSKKEGYFNSVQIWYDDKSPDPACIGLTGYWGEATFYSDSNDSLKSIKFLSKKECIDAGAKRPQFYNTQKYLLGKWADVKHSFNELKEMATKRYIAEKGDFFRKAIKSAQRDLDDLETNAFDLFN